MERVQARRRNDGSIWEIVISDALCGYVNLRNVKTGQSIDITFEEFEVDFE